MKKLLLSGITAVALMAAGTAQAGGLDLFGGTGVARTPLAMSLAPMQFQIAAEYVASDDLFIPMRAAVGLPYGIELGGAYWYADADVEDLEIDSTIWDLTAKYVLPKFVDNLGLAVGGHYNQEEYEAEGDELKMNGYDFYGVATYTFPVGEGMSLIPSVGVVWEKVTFEETGFDDVDEDGFRFFGSLLLKADKFAVGAEYISTNDDLDGEDADASYWFGGRYFLNPMITLQAGYINNANILDDEGNVEDGVFHVGAQFAFGGGK